MPLANWGGGSGDASSFFASLVQGMENEVRADAARLDARHEADLAAQDAETFAKYQAGKLTDDQWMAYIQHRKSQTYYDKTQQANWVKAELEWGQKIADDKAQAHFEATNDYGTYIGYLQGKLAKTKDSAGRLAIQEQIRGLTDQRDQKVISSGEQAIKNKIETGKATQEDLLRFYRQQRANLRSGSPLKDLINQNIADLTARIASDRFETNLTNLYADFRSGDLTPVQFAKRERALLGGSTLQQTNPTRYNGLLDESYKVQYSPDPAKKAQLDYQLATGQITPDQYQTTVNKWADLLMDYDTQAAWELRNAAASSAQQAQAALDANKLPNPGALSGYTNPKVSGYSTVTGAFKWMSQMDGTQYQSLNCTMASGAMLAYAMGYKGLSGGDLRYLTGDTMGGTNIDQLYGALGKAGVDTSGMQLVHGGQFEKFKQMVGNGRPVVIVGNNANLPAGLKAAAWMNGLHGLLVGEYDPKKDAFHVFNSAMSRSDPRSKDGYWMPAAAMEAFGFGPGVSGSWLAAPKGTVDPSKAHAWHVIDVETPPQRPNTPKSYKGLRNPGASGNQRGAVRATGQVKPFSDNPTKQDVLDRQAADQQRLDQIDQLRAEGKIPPGGDPAIDKEVLSIYEENVHMSQSLGDYDNAANWRDQQAKYITSAKERNGALADQAFNTIVRGISSDISNLGVVTDPLERQKKLDALNQRFQDFATAKTAVDPNNPTSGIDPAEEAKIQAYGQGLATAVDPNVPLDQKRDAINELLNTQVTGPDGKAQPLGKASSDWTGTGTGKGDDIGNTLTATAGLSEDTRVLSAGQGEVVVVNGRTTVVPYLPNTVPDPTRKNPDGTPLQVPQLDLSTIGLTNGTDLPRMLIQSPQGPTPVHVVPNLIDSGLTFLKSTRKTDEWGKDHVLTTTELGNLTIEERQRLLANGTLTSIPWQVESITTPDTKDRQGNIVAGAVYVQDPGTKKWFVDHLPLLTAGVIGLTPEGDADVTYEPNATAKGYDLPPAGNVDGKAAQKHLDNGDWNDYLSGIYRDANGDVSNDPAYAPSRLYTPPTVAEMLTDFSVAFLRKTGQERQDQMAAQQTGVDATEANRRSWLQSQQLDQQSGINYGQGMGIVGLGAPTSLDTPQSSGLLDSIMGGSSASYLDGLAKSLGVKTSFQPPAPPPSQDGPAAVQPGTIAYSNNDPVTGAKVSPPPSPKPSKPVVTETPHLNIHPGVRPAVTPSARPASTTPNVHPGVRAAVTPAAKPFVPPPPPKTKEPVHAKSGPLAGGV